MPTRYERKPPLRHLAPLPREFPETNYVLVLDPPYTDERLTDILRLLAESAERGESCPFTVLNVKEPFSMLKDKQA